MNKKKITSKDIAKALGISRTVVSFVLNGKSKEKRISDELTRKVLDYIETNNYKPNFLATSLRTGRSQTIGLIVADISNPFFAKLARHIESEATSINYSVIFCSSDENPENFKKHLATLKNRQVDGFILIPPIGSENTLNSLISQEIPFVIIDRLFENIAANTVTINNFESAFDATKRLIDYGRKNIALVNVNQELYTMDQRAQGYLEAIRTTGLNIQPELIKQLTFSHGVDDINKAVTDVITNNADAILFTTNKLGINGIKKIRELGKSIPKDIAVISFDDIDSYEIAFTPISAIRQPLDQISKVAIRILNNKIESEKPEMQTEDIVLKTELMLRESCL